MPYHLYPNGLTIVRGRTVPTYSHATIAGGSNPQTRGQWYRIGRHISVRFKFHESRKEARNAMYADMCGLRP